MNYCPNCGTPVEPGQNFCRNCGRDVKEQPAVEQVQGQAEVLRGLGRNTLTYLMPDGVRGVGLTSTALLFLAVLVPLFLFTAIYYVTQEGAFAIYLTLWVATSLLLYDELRWRGLRSLGPSPPSEGDRRSWLTPWQSIRMADWNGRTLWFTSRNPDRRLSITFDKDAASLVEKTLGSKGVRYSWRSSRLPPVLSRFWTLVLLLFIIGQLTLILAAVLPFFPGEEQTYITILNNTKSSIAGTTFIGEFQAIFVNNVQVALGGAVPFLGTLTYGIANYNTGRVVQAIALTAQTPVQPYAVLVALYVLPHTWVEESAYPITTMAGIFALTKWRSVSPAEFMRWLNRGSAKLVLALVGSAAVLLVAGFIETLTTYLGYAAVGLWVPLIIIAYAWSRIRRRRRALQLASSP
jgi:uncharacterized membrane protein SpoIIM required for sporulation